MAAGDLYKDLTGPSGTENNMGGTEQFFYFTPRRDIKTWGEPASADLGTDDEFSVKTAHIMNTGKKFNQMYTTIDTSELEGAPNGEIDGRSEKLTFKFFYPGSEKECNAFKNRAKRDQFIFIIPLANGKLVQIGSKKWSSYVTGTFKTGTTSGRGAGTEFEVTCHMPDLLYYEAAIPLVPAV
jgi:hypothetical protein